MKNILLERDTGKGYAMGVPVGRPVHRFLRGLLEFPVAFYAGAIWYRYPLCCVWQWCVLNLTELPQALVNRAFVDRDATRGDGYVRCAKCVAELQPDRHITGHASCGHDHGGRGIHIT